MAGPENKTDALEDELNAGNKEPGVQGMLKPSDMIARETAGAQGAQAAPGAQGSNNGGEDSDEAIDYQAILKKVDSGQELSDDELALVQMMQAENEKGGPGSQGAQDAPKTYNIGGKAYSAVEIEQQMRTEYNLPAEMELSDASKQKMIDRFVKGANRTEQQRQNQVQSEVNARERQANMVERLHLQNERKRLQEAVQQNKAERQRLTRVKETLSAAAKGLVPQDQLIDPTTNQIDTKKLMSNFKAEQAAEQLPEVERQISELDKSERENEGRALQAEVMAFIADHPQYKTEGDPFALWEKLSRGEVLAEQDEIRVLELDQLISDSRAKGVPIDKVFTIRKAQRTLAVAEPAQTGTRATGKLPLPELRSNPKTMAEIIRRHQARVQASPQGGGQGGGGGERGNAQKSTARLTIEQDRKILGQADDAFVKELGF